MKNNIGNIGASDLKRRQIISACLYPIFPKFGYRDLVKIRYGLNRQMDVVETATKNIVVQLCPDIILRYKGHDELPC
jgi:hypothetical protein